MTTHRAAAALLAALLTCGGTAFAGQANPAATPAPPLEGDDLKVSVLLQAIESAARADDSEAAYERLLASSADRPAASRFVATELSAKPDRIVVQERDRVGLRDVPTGEGFRLTADAFMEFGDRGRVATWAIDVRRVNDDWLIGGQQIVSSVENLFRLSLNVEKQFDARHFNLLAEDLELTLVEGSVFVVENREGVTGLVLLGRGELRFHPDPETEKGQVRIFAGTDVLVSRFEAAYVRVGVLEAHADPSVLKPRPVDPRDLRRAEEVFRVESRKSFVVDLADLTRDTWSLMPGAGDFLAEVRTRRAGTLTYARSANEPEDISFFDRARQRNIAMYASKEKLATRGRFYDEDELSPIDVLDYDIDVTAQPDREWIDGRVVMRLKVRAASIGQLTIKLADSLVVRSVTSDEFGRLFNLRVANQNTILVNLPVTLVRNTEMVVTIEYGGRLEPQAPERETVSVAQQQPRQDITGREGDELLGLRTEPTYLYSNRSFWYPQAGVTDYATATMRISVPAVFTCVASGESTGSPEVVTEKDPAQSRKIYEFAARRPLRYLAFLVTKLARADRWTIAFDEDASEDAPAREAGPSQAAADGALSEPAAQHESKNARYEKLDLIVDAHPRQTGRGRDAAEKAVDIVKFYESLLADSPYSSLTVTLLESRLPGGHSPGYFAILNEPLPTSGVTWRGDPAAFSSYPEFFLAHEIAHQWWGQAVAGRNYHEQWLSEGFAQYFAALYAQRRRGNEVFQNVLRQMRKWAIQESGQGPVYLGYRIGHIKGEGRAFRAVIYNKGASVLHMLRLLIGDEAFFGGLRRFYDESRFTKAGTENLRLAMEAASGRPLDRFFERWIYNAALPKVAMRYEVEQSADSPTVVLHFEQTGDIFDLPVTVNLQYADRRTTSVTIPVTDRVVTARIPLDGTLRSVEISKDDMPVADIVVGR